MSFEKAIKKDIPLIKDNTNENFNQLQNNFLIFIKNFDEIQEYDRKLNFMNRKEYDSIKLIIQPKIKQIPGILDEITIYIKALKESDFKDPSTKSKVFSQIDIINQKLIPKRIELTTLLNRIVEKESRITRRMTLDSHNESLNNSYTSFDSQANLDPIKTHHSHRNSFDSSNLVVKDVQDNLNYLKKRQEELEEIKKVSGQIKELSSNMVIDLNTQRDNLNIISLSIEETKENVKKADKEIEIAERESRKSSRRILWIFLFILFTIASIISVGVCLYFGKKEQIS